MRFYHFYSAFHKVSPWLHLIGCMSVFMVVWISSAVLPHPESLGPHTFLFNILAFPLFVCLLFSLLLFCPLLFLHFLFLPFIPASCVCFPLLPSVYHAAHNIHVVLGGDFCVRESFFSFSFSKSRLHNDLKGRGEKSSPDVK